MIVNQEGNRVKRTLSGRIVSDKMQNTVTVLVERRVKHKLYGKVISQTKKFHAHIDTDMASKGDLVLIEECRPISKTKSWKVVSVLEKGLVV